MTMPVAWASWRLAFGTEERVGEFRGARLGMTAEHLRRTFDAGGLWRAAPHDAGDLRLEWVPAAGAAEGGARHVTFELHEGLLVAIRAELDPSAPEASCRSLDVSDAAVRARGPIADGGVLVRVIARNCPTHAAEVGAILGGS
jgi:hypothetical protein